jgi:hypothetical protein
MEPIGALLLSLRYLVFADRNRRHLVAAFEFDGEARQYMHLHCPCSGELVDRHKEDQSGSGPKDQ